MNKYNIDLNFIEYNNYNEIEFLTSKHVSDNNIKWIVPKIDTKRQFILKIKFSDYYPIIGIGFSNRNSDNLFNILNPSMWLCHNSNDVGFAKFNEFEWVKDSSITSNYLYCGFINNKVFFVTPGKKIYCTSFNSKNRLCICSHIDTDIIYL